VNDFFTNLVGRHLGTCDTIQPRTLGRFESGRGRVAVACPDEGTNPLVSESDQMLQPPQPPGEAPYEPPKETASEINPLESTDVKRDYSIDPRSAFSVDVPKVTVHESDPIGNKKEDSSPSLPEQSDPSAQPGLSEQQAVLSDSHVLPGKPYDTQPLDTDRYSHLGDMKQQQQEQANKTALVIDEHDAFSDGHMQTNINEQHEVMRDKNPPPASLPGEHYLESELNHRIRTMLQRLADDPVSPTTEPAPDDRGSQNNESLISTSSEKKAPSLDTTVASLNPAPTLEQQADNLDRNSADDREISALHSRLEPPSWLPELEAKFNQRLQEKEAKAEPVINVTIGRVEVRAVQSETPKQAKHQKKPTGVMSLDDYLKQRERGGEA
jgi:hypothetical protein